MRRVVYPVVVGRERELAELRAALDRAGAGGGGLLVLLGEAGIGKSPRGRTGLVGAPRPGRGHTPVSGGPSRRNIAPLLPR